jgi:hypothetical protein
MFVPEKSAVTADKLSWNKLLMSIAITLTVVLSGCAEYGHIPLASKQRADEKTATALVQVTLRWNNVPGAASYNVYWSRFPGVTRHNSYKIPDAANPIAITDLEPGTTYYFVVTVVGDSGESKESREMSFTGVGAAGVIDFKDLLEQPAPASAPPVKPVKSPAENLTPPAAPKKTPPAKQAAVGSRNSAEYYGTARATLAWDNVADANSYNIYWRHRPGVTKQNGTKIENVKNPHTLENLIPGKTYYLVVTAVSKDGESNISEEISYTVK